MGVADSQLDVSKPMVLCHPELAPGFTEVTSQDESVCAITMALALIAEPRRSEPAMAMAAAFEKSFIVGFVSLWVRSIARARRIDVS